MEAKEQGVWFCDHALCGVLTVAFPFPGFYKYHSGSLHLNFDREAADDYLQGRQSLEDLVETVL